MTKIYFVRHAQPDESWEDDRTRPLTSLGMEDRKAVTACLSAYPIDAFYASPYRRSVDTISGAAQAFGMEIHTDERFRERKQGKNSYDYLQQRWENFDFCEPGGECLRSVQTRNIEAMKEVLLHHPNQSVVIGTHGTALSSILHYYNPAFASADFLRIRLWMPYILRLDFEDGHPGISGELLVVNRGY